MFTGFDIFYPVKNTVKVHRFLTGFSQGLSQVFSQGKNSQGFSQGFAWVLTLWKLPFSQGLNSFTPCEKGVKNMWENMWNWTVHMFFHSLIHRFFTAFSRFYPVVYVVWMTQKTRKGTLRVKIQNISWGACPRNLLKKVTPSVLVKETNQYSS